MDHSIKKDSSVVAQSRLHYPRIITMQKIKQHSRKVLLGLMLVSYCILFYMASH